MAGYRDADHIIPGFNLVIADVDGGITIDTAKLLLVEYSYMMYTTKRHTSKVHRFRIIFPMSHKLHLNKIDYKEFMSNFFDWLPFEVDRSASDIARKWLTNGNGSFDYNDGALVDATMFIPKTKKSSDRKKIIDSQQSLTNVERWFCTTTDTGNRSNQLIKYAYMLVDAGMDVSTVQDKVVALNSKLPNSLTEMELMSTIMQTASKQVYKRDNQI